MITDYVVAQSLAQALEAVAENPEKTRVIAGGTDGFAQFDKARRSLVCLDIGQAADLNFILAQDERLTIGAAVTLSRLAKSPEVKDQAPALVEAALDVGTPQIRNQGTVVGNILTNRAVASLRVCSASLGAFLKLKGTGQERDVPVLELAQGKVRLDRSEIAIALVVPGGPGLKASAYRSLRPRRSFSYPSASACASVSVIDGLFGNVGLTASPVLPAKTAASLRPCLSCAGKCRVCRVVSLSGLAEALAHRPATEDEINRAVADFDWQSLPLRDSVINGPAEYRRHLLQVLSQRALAKAVERSEGEHE